jgi:hypothetical protein
MFLNLNYDNSYIIIKKHTNSKCFHWLNGGIREKKYRFGEGSLNDYQEICRKDF